MALNKKFRAALKIIDNLTPRESSAAVRICEDIRRSEERLSLSGRGVCQKGMCKAQGLCCRNIDLDEIIQIWDFVYIFLSDGSLIEPAAERLKHEGLFAADCLFLENGVGPCFFPESLRPEVCITAFCGDDWPVRLEVRKVQDGFARLSGFFAGRGLRSLRASLGRRRGLYL